MEPTKASETDGQHVPVSETGSTNAELTAELIDSSSPGTAVEPPIDSGLWQLIEYSDEDVADLVTAMRNVQPTRAA
jgi:hypothetical protein